MGRGHFAAKSLSPSAASILAAIALLQAQPGSAQATPSPQPEFDVASIRAVKTNAESWIGVGGCLTPDPSRGACHGRFDARAANVKMLIEYAYHLRRIAISGGPGWVGSEPDFEGTDTRYMKPPVSQTWSEDDGRYNITAKGNPDATEEQIRSMLKTLLAQRFQLKIHSEMRDLPLFELVVAKGGPKLREAAECTPSENGCGGVARTLAEAGFHEKARRISMSRYADYLAALPAYLGIGRPVLDKTGLGGFYDFTLEFAPGSNYSGPSLFTALQEQVGLRLEAKRGPVDVLVIDGVRRPSEN